MLFVIKDRCNCLRYTLGRTKSKHSNCHPFEKFNSRVPLYLKKNTKIALEAVTVFFFKFYRDAHGIFYFQILVLFVYATTKSKTITNTHKLTINIFMSIGVKC